MVSRKPLGGQSKIRAAKKLLLRTNPKTAVNHQDGSAYQKAFIKTALDAIIIIDHKGRVTEFNPAAERIFGFKREEALGKELAELIIPPTYREAHRHGISNYLKTGRGAFMNQRIEITAIRKSGEEFPVELAIARIGRTSPPVFMGTIRDISDRVNVTNKQEQIEERLRKEQEQKTFLLSLSDTFRKIDNELKIGETCTRLLAEYLNADRCYVSHRNQDRGSVWLGPEFYRDDLAPIAGEYKLAKFPESIWQLSSKQLIIRNRTEDTRLSRANKRALASTSTNALLITTPRQDKQGNAWLLAVSSTEPRDWTKDELHLVEEVSERVWSTIERVRAEAAIAASENRFRTLIEQSADGIQMVDSTGRLLYSSDSVERITGFKPTEIVGDDAVNHIHPDDWPTFQKKLEALLKHPNKPQTLEYRVRHKDGSWVWVETTGTNHLKTPNINALVGNFRNITDRKLAEMEVRNSENRFRALIENSSDGIAVFDELGKLTFLSPSVASILGYTVEEMMAHKNLGELTHPDDVEYLTKSFAKITRPGELANATYRTRAKDGNYRWVEVIIKNAINNPAVKGYIINYRDVTDQKQSRTELAASERRYRFLADNSSDIITMVDRDGTILYQSPSLERVLGNWPGRENANIFKSPLVHPDDKAAKNKFVKKLIDGGPGTYKRSEFRMRHKEGKWRVLEVIGINLLDNPEVGGVMLTSRDVTQRKMTERALIDSDARLKQAQSAGNIGVFEWDLVANNITYSEQAEILFGHKPGNNKDAYAYGLGFQRINPEDRAKMEAANSQAIKDKKELNTEFRINRADNGEERWLSIRANASYDSSGKPEKLIGVLIDITDRKRLEQQKDNFIAVTTHELKTPITSMKMYTQILERRFRKSGDEVAASTIDLVDKQLNRLSVLIGDLLDITKIESGQFTLTPSEFDYDELVKETIAALQVTTTSHKIRQRGKAKTLVTIDRERVTQVLTNLIENAVKYSPDAPNVTVSVTKAKGRLITCVSDHGIGIAKSDQPHLFERFTRVGGKSTAGYPGLGLGLFISSEILQRLGGRIWVESAKGKGSKFYFDLPIASSTKRIYNNKSRSHKLA